MRILHILRSEPEEVVRQLMDAVSEGEEAVEFPIYEGEVDYARLLAEIFQSDRVISWW
jgi:hypothetical protein